MSPATSTCLPFRKYKLCLIVQNIVFSEKKDLILCDFDHTFHYETVQS